MFNQQTRNPLPVSDLRITIAAAPESEGLQTTMRLTARGHVFELAIERERARIRVSPIDQPERALLDMSEEVDGLPAGRTSVIEFSHVDQALRIRIDGDTVLAAEYDWDAWQRLEHAIDGEIREILATSHARNPLASQALPKKPALELVFEGAAATITRLAVDRDIYYRPVDGYETIGTHPRRTVTLGEDQFFMLGDNSAASADGRLWGESDELVAAQVDPAPFVVNRDLIIGKAWSVYFPSPHPLVEGGRRFIPDFGRMRFIR